MEARNAALILMKKSHFDRTLQYIDFLVYLLFQVMKDYQLYLIILVLITIDVIILTTWQIVDPFYRQTKKLEPYVSTVWAYLTLLSISARPV